jgi:4-carboxymuconolactone decarboxylase
MAEQQIVIKIKIMMLSVFMLTAFIKINSQNMKKIIPNISAYPIGEPLPEKFAQYFTGQAYLATLTSNSDLNCPVMNVTFEPSCRNNWHSHTGGQLLIAVGGKGYYQEKGKKARLLLPGDVVEIPCNVEHWHGAAPDSWFSHLAIETNPKTNKNTWFGAVTNEEYKKVTSEPVTTSGLSEEAVKNHEKWFPGYVSKVKATDPELIEVFDNFAFDEVLNHGKLDTKTRIMVTLASCIAQHTVSEYKMMLNAAISNGVSPVEIKEILYQAVAYVGIARVIDYIGITNEFLLAHGVKLPLEPQSTTTPKTRYEHGLALQKEIFGQMIDDMEKAAPANQKHIQRYLSANCFGDYQTRNGLDKRMRELMTFSILISLGGCEPQVKGHIRGNVAVGNDKEYLLDVVTQLLPYIGYPRTLNAINCLNEVLPEKE